MAKILLPRCLVIMAALAKFIPSCLAAPVEKTLSIDTSSGCLPEITYVWTTATVTIPHPPYDSTSTVVFLYPAPTDGTTSSSSRYDTEPPFGSFPGHRGTETVTVTKSSSSESSSSGDSRIKTVKVTKTITPSPSGTSGEETTMAVSSVPVTTGFEPVAVSSSATPALARRSSSPDDTMATTLMVAEPSHLPDKIITVTTTVTGLHPPPPPTSKTLVMVIVTVVEPPVGPKPTGSKTIVPMVAKRTWDDHPHGPPRDHPFHHGEYTWSPAAAAAPSSLSDIGRPSSKSFDTSYGPKPTSVPNDEGNDNNNKNTHDNGNDAAQGTAYVINNCPFGVMSNIVHGTSGVDSDGVPPEEIMSSIAPGQTVSHPFSHDPNTGVSWKIWRTDVSNQAPVQFEYAWIPEAKRTWWDLSMIDAGKVGWLDEEAGNAAGEDIVGDRDGYGAYVGRVGVKHAFVDEGMSLVPSVQDGICQAVVCRPGEQFCKTAYNVWNDWGQQRDCAETVDLTLTLCG
ncbi:hypothetical protein LTS17_004262 [Exophiala oligosperma]